MRLDREGRRVRAASVRSTRPLATPRVLVGRTPADAAAIVPLLYSVCACAQGAAAASALAFASGTGSPATVMATRGLAVALEALQEDLRRLLIDLPAALGEAPDVAPVADARRLVAPVLAAAKPALALVGDPVVQSDAALGDALRRIVATHVLGIAPEAFVALRDADALLAWARGTATAPARVIARVLDESPALGASDVAPMPPATREAVASAVLAALDADPRFAHTPLWAGVPVETGALANATSHAGLAAFVARHGRSVPARLLARLVGIAQTATTLDGVGRIDAWSPRAGEGVATVRTARGLLLHRARVAGGRVTDYAIVAPTEWNFHPQGALVRSLSALDADDANVLARHADLVVQALDPCVACTVEVRDA